MSLPAGTVTFLFTDIEGSTKLWEQHPDAMRAALARHDVLMHQAIAAQDGAVFKTMGDAFCAAFATSPQALSAALTAQQALQNELWPDEITLRVRMALHTGTADERDGDYFGPPLNRVARMLSTGHGGQTLLSLPTYELTRDFLPPGCVLQDLGAHSLRDLARPEQVFQCCHPQLLSEFPPLKSLDMLPNNLPVQLTSFVGRKKEMIRVKDLLAKTHLLTLTGSGGCGKTRLSLQTAADVLDQYADGVWLVELASITDANLVPQAVANVLGVKEQTGKTYTQSLTEFLKAKALLLVLDNCEHVLSACAKLTDVLLRACPNVQVLASSREGLGIAGETVYRIPSLSLPDPKQIATPENLSAYEAVTLFLERAASAKPDFTITNANAPALASVCHRLDGIPLAIELAAARVRSLSVEEIHSKLDNLYRLLTGGSRTALPRQQTLRALIDWSFGLLTDQEKALLCRLSVFAGGWTLSAAEVVCTGMFIGDWEVLDLLTSLADKSLVQTDEADGATRYRFLEAVRQYARERLAEGDEILSMREQHLDYFLQVAEGANSKLDSPEQGYWLAVLETEHDNLRQAITFCLEDPKDLEKGMRLGTTLLGFWLTRGHLSEGRARLTALLSRPEAQEHTKAHADALNSAGVLAINQGDYSAARSLLEESRALFREMGNKNGIASSLANLGWAAYDQGDYTTARHLCEESLAIQQELGHKSSIAAILGNLGALAQEQGDYSTAQSLIKESLTIERELGNKKGIASALNNLGSIAHGQADHAAAELLYWEALGINRELGNRAWEAINLCNLGIVASKQGDYTAARHLYEESLAIKRELGFKTGIASALGNLGIVARDQGDYVAARTLLGECLMIFREVEDRNDMANCLQTLGRLAAHQGEYPLARSQHEESLRIRWDLGHRPGIAESLEGVAFLAVLAGNRERAASLFGAAEALREAIDSQMELSEREQYEQHLATARETLGDEAFAAAWAAGRAMSMEQAVEYALGA